MRQRIDLKVYNTNNDFLGTTYAVLKYEGHLEVLVDIYRRHSLRIEVV